VSRTQLPIEPNAYRPSVITMAIAIVGGLVMVLLLLAGRLAALLASIVGGFALLGLIMHPSLQGLGNLAGCLAVIIIGGFWPMLLANPDPVPPSVRPRF
jgi:O-antigen ligase